MKPASGNGTPSVAEAFLVFKILLLLMLLQSISVVYSIL